MGMCATMWLDTHMNIEVFMLKTIQITLPEHLLTKIDRTVAELDINRSGFARQAFEDALFRLWVEDGAAARGGLCGRPENPDEMTLWESVQDWGDPYPAR